jgi:hypothetical protein
MQKLFLTDEFTPIYKSENRFYRREKGDYKEISKTKVMKLFMKTFMGSFCKVSSAPSHPHIKRAVIGNGEILYYNKKTQEPLTKEEVIEEFFSTSPS